MTMMTTTVIDDTNLHDGAMTHRMTCITSGRLPPARWDFSSHFT
jgi:hypothetical protein